MFKKIEESVHNVIITQRNLDTKTEFKDIGVLYAKKYFNQ